MRRLGLFCLLGLLPNFLHASDAGTQVGGSLQQSVGARQRAMGEIGVATVNGAEAMFWNPAVLGSTKNTQMYVSHSLFVEDISHSYLALGGDAGQKGGYGISINYFQAGTIEGRNDVGIRTDSFSPTDLAAAVGYSWGDKRFRLGGAVKFIHSEIIKTAQTFSLDLGIHSMFNKNRTRAGITGRNLFGELKYSNIQEDLLSEYKLGISHQFSPHILATVELQYPEDSGLEGGAGIEMNITPQQTTQTFIRTGYNQRLAENKDDFSGLTLGLGVLMGWLQLDYAYIPLGELDQSHTFGVSITFR
jgi:hypothetical protein